MDGRAHLGTLVASMKTLRGTAVVEHRGVRRFATSYPELAEMAERFAAELLRRGIGPGERVLLWGVNSAPWMAAFWGCVLRGVLPVPLDAGGSAEFAGRVARETAPKLVVGDRGLRLSGLGVPTLFLDELAALGPGLPVPWPELGPHTPLQILFTSGTTGEPKGVVHTHGNLLASIEPIEREIAKYLTYERWVRPLRFLHTLPLSHVFGQFMGLWVPPLLGAQVHYEDRTARLLTLIPRERVHVLAAVPRTLELLRGRLQGEFGELDLNIEAAQGAPLFRRWWRFRRVHRRLGLRFWAAVCGGATLAPELERFWTTLGFALVQGYGLTETAALVTLNHPFKAARGSVGAPLPGRSVRVSESGELEVSGPMVAAASWERGGLIQRADPWLRTGDLASVEDGRVRFLGRTGQRLVTPAGLNVYLQDVEQALERQPGVAGAVVFGLGAEPAAVIASYDADATGRAIDAANRELQPHQRVRRWWRWPGGELPRTATGKVRRGAVEAWAREQLFTGAAASSEEDAATTLLMEAGARRGPFGNEARLDEDWGLDSMGRVALAAALEERAGVSGGDAAQNLRTLGELRALLRGASGSPGKPAPCLPDGKVVRGLVHTSQMLDLHAPFEAGASVRHRYPTWPWSAPARLIRLCFTELLLRPLVFLLASPRVTRAPGRLPDNPMLLISNHRTLFDAALLLYALPFSVRRRAAIMMSGEILAGLGAGWSRRPLPPSVAEHRRWWGPPAAFALRLLFNVFSLPRLGGFRDSFAHAGCALDRGMHVLLFPEGRRMLSNAPVRFRPGLGILARESYVPVLPMAVAVPEGLKARGSIGVVVGAPIAVHSADTPEQVTARLQGEVAQLAAGASSK